jgi:hypothetical protein
LSGEARNALGYPPGQYDLVVDQWGNPVIPVNPPGSFGVDETGNPLAGAGTVPPWPPEEWPPGYGESDQIEGLDEEGVMFSPEELDPLSGLEAAVQPDSVTVPLEGAEAVTPDLEPMSADLGETQSADPSDSYSGVQMTEGEVVLDDDFSSESAAADELITAGLDAPAGRETVADQVAEADDVTLESTESDGLLTAGLDASESAVEDVEFELIEVESEPPAEPELRVVEPVEEVGYIPIPVPQPEFKVEEVEQTVEVVETEMTIDDAADLSLPKLTEPEEETTALEPIEIVVESLDIEPVRGVSAVEETTDRITPDESEEEEPDLEA